MNAVGASVVDGAAVAKILAAALIIGVGLTGAYGLAIRSVERILVARRGDGGTSGVLLDGLLVAVVAVLCVAAVVAGVVAMTHKS